MAQRSDANLIAAAIDQLVAGDAGIAAVQACVALDGNLRQRYAKVGPACRLSRLHKMLWCFGLGDSEISTE